MRVLSIFIGLLVSHFSLSAAEFYWVNGSGQWTDFQTHWATSSGGTNFHTSQPGPFDHVIFDDQSFVVPGAVVTMDTTYAACASMDWSGAQFIPTFLGNAGDTLDINGHCSLNPNMTWAWQGLTRFLKTAPTTDTLDLAEHIFLGDIQVEGNGTWIAVSDIKTISTLWFRRGTLNMEGDTLFAQQFWMRDPDNQVQFIRDFQANTAVMIVTGSDSAWVMQGSTTFNGTLATALFAYPGPDRVTAWTGGFFGTFGQVFLPPTEISLEEGLTTLGLSIAPGATILLQPDTSMALRYAALTADGTCGAYISIQSILAGTQAYLDHDPATPLTASFLRLKDLELLDGDLTANSSLNDGNLTGSFTLNEPTSALTFYWINDGGNWHDTTHWSLTSGGPISGCIPGPRDNVIFDANSFAQADTILLTQIPYCADWDASALAQNVVLTGAVPRAVLNGALILSPLMQLDFVGEWQLQGTGTHDLTSAGLTIPGPIRLQGTGTYQQTDALQTDSTLYMDLGTWEAIGLDVTAYAIWGDSLGTQVVDLSQANVRLTGADTVWWLPASQTVDLTDAALRLVHAGTGEAVFVGEDRTYDSLFLQNRYTLIRGDNQFAYLDIAPSHSLSLANSSTQRVDSLAIVSDCQNPFFLQSESASDTAATLQKIGYDTLSIDNVILNHVAADTASGGFYEATNAVGYGTLDGWTIVGGGAGTTYYWINGTGNWNDPMHWSLASGGAAAACLPGPRDTVVFDNNSFVGAQDTVYGNIDMYFARMDWSGVPAVQSPVWSQTRNAFAGENIVLCPTMEHQRTQADVTIVFQPDGNNALFDPQGVGLLASVQMLAANGTDTLRLGNNLILLDTISSVILTEGALLTEDFEVEAGLFFASTAATKYLELGASELRFNSGWIANLGPAFLGGDLTIDAGTSTIFIGGGSSPTFFQGGGYAYNDVTILPSQGRLFQLSQSNTFENLTFEAGVVYRIPFGSTHTQTVNQDLTAIGSCEDSITIASSSAAALSGTVTFDVTGNVTGECLRLQNTTLAGTATGSTVFFSNDLNATNTGWDFSALQPATALFTAPTPVCLEDLVTFTSTSTAFNGNPGDLALFWDYDDGTTDTALTMPTHLFPQSGDFDVTLIAEYTNGCRDTATQTIEVLSPVLDVQFTPNQLQICENELVTFTVYDNPSASYDFLLDGVLVQTGADTVFTTDSVQQGEQYVVTSLVGGCVARSDTFSFFVTPAPTIPIARSVSSDTICAGDSIWFYTSGGNLYRWYVDDSLLLQTPTDSLLLTNITDGQQVRVEGRAVGTGCFGQSDVFDFVVNSLPDVTLVSSDADQNICQGDPVVFTAGGATSYSFFADGALIATNTTGSLLNTSILNGQTISVTGELQGCIASSSLPFFTVRPNPVAGITSSDLDNTICAGEGVLFTASGAPTFQFLINGVSQGPFSGSSTLLSNSLLDGDAVQAVALLNGCLDTTASLVFDVIDLPIVSLAANIADTLCVGDSVTFTASGATLYDFLVNGNPVATQTTNATFGTSGLINGQTVTAIGYEMGCSSPAPESYTYVVKPLPLVSVFKSSAANSICLGDSAIFVASGATSYEFLVDGQSQGIAGMNNPFTATGLAVGNPIITVLGTLNGCTALSTNTATVEVKPLPDVLLSLSPVDTSLCQGDTVEFTANGATNYQFLIDGIAQGPSIPVASFITSTLQDGQVVRARGELNGCTSLSNTSFTFSVSAPPVVGLSSDDADQVICEGTPVTFTGTGAQQYSFFVDGVLQTGPAPNNTLILSSLQNGQTISLTGETNGCEAAAPQLLTFSVNPLPIVTATISDPDTSICAGEAIVLQASGGINYQFFLDGVATGPVSATAQYQTSSLQDGQTLQVIGFSNQNCPDSSGIFTFEVLPIPTVSLNVSDNNLLSCEGDTVIFTANGASVFEFFLDGQSLGAASAQNTYTTDSLQTGQTITVTGFEGACSADGDTTFSFVVNEYPTVTFTTDPADLTICEGDTLFILGAGAPEYQLYVNGQAVGQPTSNNLFTPTNIPNGAQITLLGINQECARLSDSSKVARVFEFPGLVGLTSSDPDLEICLFDTIIFTGSGAIEYIFTVNGQPRDTLFDPWAFGGLQDGDQVSVIGSNGGCESASPDVLTFSVNRLNLGLQVAPSLIVCEGEPVTFTASGGDLYEFFVDELSQGAPTTGATYTLNAPLDGQEVTFSATSLTTGCVQPALSTRRLSVLTRPDLIYTGQDSVCQGDSTLLFATNLPTNGNLRWLKDGFPLPGAFADSLLVTESGDYTVASTLGGQQQIWSQGGNERGQLGDTTTFDRDEWLPVTPADEPYLSVAAGGRHSLGVKASGRVDVWGANDFGQLGLGTFSDRTFPVQVASITNAAAVAAGEDFSLVLLADGALFAFGANDKGQLGLGSTAVTNFPFQVPLASTVDAIVAGKTHALALLPSGQVFAWGANESGQLGDGTQTDQLSPVAVTGLSNVVAIAAGDAHSLALDDQGRLWAWGNNAQGQLGLGGITGSSVPVQVSLFEDVTDVAAGNSHSLILTQSGLVRATGANDLGQLGTGDQQEQRSFRSLNAPGDGAQVFAGYGHSFLLLNDGSVWGWGDNGAGELQGGSTNLLLNPVYLPEVTGSQQVAAGQRHVLALLDNFQECSSDNQMITVQAAPAASIDRSGDFLTALPAGVSYQWFFNGNAVFNQDTATLKMQQNGIYQVEITYANGCSSLSEAMEFFTTSLGENLPIALKLYPNPASTGIQLEMEGASGKQFAISLLDARGRVLRQWSTQSLEEALWIDMQSYSEGLYLLSIQAEGFRRSLKFLKKSQ